MDAALIDTDMLSEVFKQRNSVVASKAAAYLRQHGWFTLSAFSWYEIRRGYLDKQATQALARFDAFCRYSLVLPVTEVILDRAAVLWVEARRGGYSCGDADLVIAATALEHNLILVTGNVRHFAWARGLRVEDWRVP